VGNRVDFSANASVYDRRHGASVEADAVERLCAAAKLDAGARVVDIGAGTGRVAIPLAARGCDVIAAEPSPGMLAKLREKMGDVAVACVAAEGARLPLSNGCADAVVIARLLYLTPDWRNMLHEVHRIIGRGGRLLHEWGNGEPNEEWVRVREEARRLFEEAGVRSPFHPGARSEDEVDHELQQLGFVRESDLVIGPGPTITLRTFLKRLIDGELSYIWSVPENVRASQLPVLENWCERTFDLDRPAAMPRELRWTIYQNGAA
jgi:SAM-dependent methyltransferase